MNSRQKVEASLRQLERERALLQHQSAENLRKVEIETDRKRSLENECEHLWTNVECCAKVFSCPSFLYILLKRSFKGGLLILFKVILSSTTEVLKFVFFCRFFFFFLFFFFCSSSVQSLYPTICSFCFVFSFKLCNTGSLSLMIHNLKLPLCYEQPQNPKRICFSFL